MKKIQKKIMKAEMIKHRLSRQSLLLKNQFKSHLRTQLKRCLKNLPVDRNILFHRKKMQKLL